MSEQDKLDAILAEAHAFPREFSSLQLGTVDLDGAPNASYAPYVSKDGDYYIYVSELSQHTGNLKNTGRASVLFIEGENDASHLFARKRLTIECRAEVIERGTVAFETMLDTFNETFGDFIAMLRGLEDFHLIRLQPESAGYVRGFAQAFKLTGDGLTEIRHQNESGHRRAKDQKAS